MHQNVSLKYYKAAFMCIRFILGQMPKDGEREGGKKKHVIDLSFLCSSSKLYDFLYQYQLSLKCCQKCSLFLPMHPENRNKKCDF